MLTRHGRDMQHTAGVPAPGVIESTRRAS